MTDRSPPFRYRLAPLLRRDGWDRDRLGLDLERARRAFEQVDALARAALARIALAETQMRELQADDRSIPIDVRRMLQQHLQHEYAASALRQEEVREAGRLVEEAHAKFEAKRLAVGTLERHRDRQAQIHRAEQFRSGQRATDESWLTRRREGSGR